MGGKMVVLSCLDAVIVWVLLSFAQLEWELFAFGACLALAGCYFPVVRVGMTNSFGKARYGEALAAVGVIEQISSMIGSPIVNSIYHATEDTEVSIGGLTLRSIAALSVAG